MSDESLFVGGQRLVKQVSKLPTLGCPISFAFNFKCYSIYIADPDLQPDPAFLRCCLSKWSLQKLFAIKKGRDFNSLIMPEE